MGPKDKAEIQAELAKVAEKAIADWTARPKGRLLCEVIAAYCTRWVENYDATVEGNLELVAEYAAECRAAEAPRQLH